MIVTVTADQVAHLPDGRIVIAKPGDRVARTPFPPVGTDIPWKYDPPADLGVVTEPCRHQHYDLAVSGEHGTSDVPCPDCHAGRPLFDLRVECDCACHRLKSKYPGLSHDVLKECRSDGSCVDGFITHAGLYAPGPLLSVVNDETFDFIDIGAYEGPLPIITFDPHENALIVYEVDSEKYRANPIDLPGAARPGWYAVIAERSET